MLNDNDQQLLIVSFVPAAKSAIYDCLVVNYGPAAKSFRSSHTSTGPYAPYKSAAADSVCICVSLGAHRDPASRSLTCRC